MMRSPLIWTGAASFGLHLAIVVTLLSSGMLLDNKVPSPAVSYVDLRQLRFPEQQQKKVDLPSKQSLLKPQQETPIIEPKTSPPIPGKSRIRKPLLPIPTTAPAKARIKSPPKPQTEPEPTRSQQLVLDENTDIAPVEVATPPSQKEQPKLVSSANGTRGKKEPLPIKTGGDSIAGSATYTMGPAFLKAAPIVAENPPPAYPRIARRSGWEGEVFLLVQVDKAGQVQKVEVDRSSGHSILDKVALKVVRNWRFHAAQFNHKPVQGEVVVPIRFELQKP